MNRQEAYQKVTVIFRDVFDDESLEIHDATSADDIEDWDSLMQITLISEVESAFNYKFAIKDVVGMQNVGEMIDILLREAAH